MKKLTIPCTFGGEKHPVDFYIGAPKADNHPIQNQSHWLSSERGGNVPSDIMDSLQRLHDLSKKNHVPFEELCSYAIESASEVSNTTFLEPDAANVPETKASDESTADQSQEEVATQQEYEAAAPEATDPVAQQFQPEQSITQASENRPIDSQPEVAAMTLENADQQREEVPLEQPAPIEDASVTQSQINMEEAVNAAPQAPQNPELQPDPNDLVDDTVSDDVADLIDKVLEEDISSDPQATEN